MVEPVILELAVNGATPRHRNRHVPRTPAEITEAALAGIESGASIVHNHNDEPMFTADGVHAVAYDAAVYTATSAINLSITPAGTNVTLSWTGGTAPFVVQETATLPAGSWNSALTTNAQSVSLPMTNAAEYFRVQGQ